MSDCPKNDIRNLENEFYKLDELGEGDIAKALDANIEKALKGDALEHSVSEVNKVLRFFGSKRDYDKWVDESSAFVGDKISSAFGKSAAKITKAFGVPIDEKKVESFFKAGVHTKLMDKLDHNWQKFNQRLHLNAMDNLNKLKNFSRDEIKDIYEALHGWKNIDDLAEHTKGAARSLRNVIDKNANELVELGVLRSEDKMENYVKHYFEPFVKRSEAEFEAHLNNLGLSEKYKRKELSKEQLEELGLMKDEYAIINTIKEQFVEIEKARRLKDLAERFSSTKEVKGWVRFGMAKGDGGVEFADTMKWGALAGKYVSPELKDAIISSQIAGEKTAEILKNWYSFIAHIKTNLTVKNPATHLANYLSNMWTAALKGDLVASQKMAAQAIANTKEFQDWRRLGWEHGLSMITDELDLGVKKTADIAKNADSKLKRAWKEFYMAEGSKAGDFVRELYNMEDGVFKLAHFKKIMEKESINGQKFDINKYFSDNSYKRLWQRRCESAMDKANYEYVDYSTRWNGLARQADRLGIAPFLQYTWKSVPMVAKNILKNPHRYAMLGFASYSMGGLSLLDREQKDASLEKWARNGNFLWSGGMLPNMFFTDSWVRVGKGDMAVNVGRILPGARLGDLNSVFGGGFIYSFFTAMNGKTSLGYDYIKEDDNTLVAAAKLAEELTKNYLPSVTMGRYFQGFGKMAVNEVLTNLNIAQKYHLPVAKDSRGNEIGVSELALRLLGVRDMRVNKSYQQSYNKAIKEAKNAKKDGDIKEAKELEAKAKRIKNYAKSDNKNLKEPRK